MSRNLTQAPTGADVVEVRAAEVALFDAIGERSIAAQAQDPACEVMRTLIRDFRSASLARGLRCTITALLAGLGPAATKSLLEEYFRSVPADTFVAVESHQFVQFLASRRGVEAAVPYLPEILAFEGALLSATLFRTSTELRWSADPTVLLEELQAGRLPRQLPALDSRMTITA